MEPKWNVKSPPRSDLDISALVLMEPKWNVKANNSTRIEYHHRINGTKVECKGAFLIASDSVMILY